jgi:WD40 repeat protein
MVTQQCDVHPGNRRGAVEAAFALAASLLELLILPCHLSLVVCVAFSPDGKRLATSSQDRTVQVYALDPRELFNLARSRATRTFTGENATRRWTNRGV